MKFAAGIIVSIIMVALSAVAAPAQYGEQPPDNVRKITLEDVTKAPDSYKDQTLLVTGVFYGIDPDGDEFYFKGKTEIIEVAPPPETKLMSEVKSNTAIAVYGKVVVRHRGDRTTVTMAARGVSVP